MPTWLPPGQERTTVNAFGERVRIPRWLSKFYDIIAKADPSWDKAAKRDSRRSDVMAASQAKLDARTQAMADSGAQEAGRGRGSAAEEHPAFASAQFVSRIGPKSVDEVHETTYGRISKLSKWKIDSSSYVTYLRGINPPLAEKVTGCASWLEWHRYFELEGSPEKLAAANFCTNLHHCQACAALRADKNVASVVPKVLTRLLERRDLRPAMLTITCRDEASLSKMIGRLTGTWSKWWQRAQNYKKNTVKRRKKWTALAHVDGAVMSCETKLGKNSGLWHFHAHIIVLVPPGLSKLDFYPEWSELLGYEASCHFKYLNSAALLESENVDLGELMETMGYDLQEPLKYAMKTNDMPHEAHYEAAQLLRGKRLMRGYGSLYNCDVNPALVDDLESFDGEVFESLIFRWKGNGYVQQTKARDW